MNITKRQVPSFKRVVGIAGAVLVLAAVPAAGEVLINEILADPASDWDGDGTLDIRGDEWVEVLNTGPETVDLTGYWLRDEAAGAPRLNLYGVLGPGEVAVFHGSAAEAWQAETGLSSGGLSLNNSGDRVVLMQTVAGSDPLEFSDIDTAVYGDHEAEDDRSCGWSQQRDQWLLFDGLAPYGGSLTPPGSGCVPTPGRTNACASEVGGRSVSFGAAKASYR